MKYVFQTLFYLNVFHGYDLTTLFVVLLFGHSHSPVLPFPLLVGHLKKISHAYLKEIKLKWIFQLFLIYMSSHFTQKTWQQIFNEKFWFVLIFFFFCHFNSSSHFLQPDNRLGRSKEEKWMNIVWTRDILRKWKVLHKHPGIECFKVCKVLKCLIDKN